jgi:carbamoyltransferase
MKKNYVGIACSQHDPAIAIVNSEGEVVYAESTERHLQNKRTWNTFADDLIHVEYLLKKYTDKDADLVIAKTWSGKTQFSLKIIFLLLPLFKKKMIPYVYNVYYYLIESLQNVYDFSGKSLRFQRRMSNPDVNVDVHNCDHHLTHAATACYSSPFQEGVCAVIDGFGESTSTSFYSYKNGEITKIPGIKKSLQSLGMFYSMICKVCGFDPIKGEEWKVMGLAPYGKYDESIYGKLKKILDVEDTRFVSRNFSVLNVYDELFEMKLKPGHSSIEAADIAYNGQLIFTELMSEILTQLHGKNISDNLILSGGCALNSACNGLLLEKTPFKKLHVYSAPGDEGNAIGAALLSFYKDNPSKNVPTAQMSPYLGESMKTEVMKNCKEHSGLKHKTLNGQPLYQHVATLLSEGKIIGWVQGRAEFGPRALGNRSILADPRSVEMKDALNSRVKFREEFRPFAPSILHEYGEEYFENYQSSPYMERTLKFKSAVWNKVPAVVHEDKTGRAQSVTRESNEKYYDLISAFNEITGVPILINTSFNVMGKPIIHSVEDALSVFFTSGLDVLVIEDMVFNKSDFE